MEPVINITDNTCIEVLNFPIKLELTALLRDALGKDGNEEDGEEGTSSSLALIAC